MREKGETFSPHAHARNYHQSPQQFAFPRVLSFPDRDQTRRDTPLRTPHVRPKVSGLPGAFFVQVMAREQTDIQVMSGKFAIGRPM
jgi:hypothetical protein